MLAGIACLSIGSCADDNISNQQEQGDLGATVSFEVSTAQENRLSQPQSAPPRVPPSPHVWAQRVSP